jgi:D-alanyl-D-alanine carboxypeptidase
MLIAAALAIVAIGTIGTLVVRSTSPSQPLSHVIFGSLRDVKAEVKNRVEQRGAPDDPPGAPEGRPPRGDGVITEEDGLLPDGVSVFESEYPGVANLDPDLLQALREAATHAADVGIEFYVTSGWRSAEYQNQLLQEAIAEYGSEEEAARWVASAETSAHVSGHAVDIGPVDATGWLSEHGAAYGLCQIYGNEPWHFELLSQAIEGGCPPMYADPTHDPRMQ